MIPNEIQNSTLRAEFEAIIVMSADELRTLDLTTRIRDQFIAGIIVPTDAGPEVLDRCWGWTGSTIHYPKRRGIIWGRGTNLYIYRIAFELHHRRRIQDGLLICHQCPVCENPICSNWRHLVEGTPARNIADCQRYGTIASGDRNGSRLHPESRPRGLTHPKCPFKNARQIQAIRAKWHAERDKFGVITALSRLTNISVASVDAAIRRYPEIPDDPAAAIDLPDLDIWRPEDRSGDKHGRSIMPEAAVELFYKLFNTSFDRSGKRRLIAYVANRYGMAEESLDDIGHGRGRKKMAKKLDQIIAGSDKVFITDELLATLFETHRPLRKKGEK